MSEASAHNRVTSRSCHLMPSRLVRQLKKNVAVHPDIKSVADWNPERRLDIQIFARDFGTELADLLTNGTGGDFAGAGILKNGSAATLRKLKAGAEET